MRKQPTSAITPLQEDSAGDAKNSAEQQAGEFLSDRCDQGADEEAAHASNDAPAGETDSTAHAHKQSW
jgi:hypothetical protein